MKRLALIGLFLGLAGLGWGADKFWQQLTAEERAAAGLDQLSPDQRTRLDQLAERYVKEGARQAVAVAQVKAKAEAIAEVKEKKKITLGLAPREDDEAEVVRTRILGDFRGWTGRTTFTLANNQVWQQEGGDNCFFPKMVDPEVEIRPARLGGWKLTLLKEGLWIRVKRIR